MTIMDAAAAIGWNVLRGLCGPRWAPTEVQLAHRRPADVQPYRRFFRAPVRFDAPHNVLVFSGTDGAVIVDSGFSRRAVDELRRPVQLDPWLDQRIMRAVREAPPLPWWARAG